MNNLDGANFLAQGTPYPDVIKNVSFHGKPSVTIKSHHYVFDTEGDAKGWAGEPKWILSDARPDMIVESIEYEPE